MYFKIFEPQYKLTGRTYILPQIRVLKFQSSLEGLSSTFTAIGFRTSNIIGIKNLLVAATRMPDFPCNGSVIALPITDVILPGGGTPRRGFQLQVGTPPQTVAAQPAVYL